MKTNFEKLQEYFENTPKRTGRKRLDSLQGV